MRCDLCEAKHQSKRNKVRTHYQGDYKQRAAWVRANATICHICGQGDRGAADPWTADHIYPGENDSLLLSAHRSCNSSRGNDTR